MELLGLPINTTVVSAFFLNHLWLIFVEGNKPPHTHSALFKQSLRGIDWCGSVCDTFDIVAGEGSVVDGRQFAGSFGVEHPYGDKNARRKIGLACPFVGKAKVSRRVCLWITQLQTDTIFNDRAEGIGIGGKSGGDIATEIEIGISG